MTLPTIDDLRARGWSVAVHNDFRINGEPYTFWLLTHPSGRWVKGEGKYDEVALAECQRQIERYSLEEVVGPYAVRMKDGAGGTGWIDLGFNTYEQAQKFWRWIERMRSK